jgi:hypothetical protein
MTSNKLVTDFNNFNLLLQGLNIKSSQRRVLANLILPGQVDVKPVIISLHIAISTITETLTDVRINIKGLMRVLADISFPKNSEIHLTLSCGFGARKRKEQTVIPVASLRQGLFLLLSDILSKDVQQYRSAINQRTPLPNIWINGHGKIINASYSKLASNVAPPSVRFRHSALTKNEVCVRGYTMARELALHVPNYRTYVPGLPWAPLHWGSIHFMTYWKCFRDLCWSEWGVGGSRLE